MRIRPCIDLKNGQVIQIVGGTLRDRDESATVNFATDRLPSYYSGLYRDNDLPGGHIISLGPGNQDAALSALSAYSGGMQMGGGITPENASQFLDAGASHVIVTSYIFQEGRLDFERLSELLAVVGKKRLVIDLSCRKRDRQYWVVTNRWQRFTELKIDRNVLQSLSAHCDEFLVHAVDVEGKRAGIDPALVEVLADSPIPITYAGGVSTWDDIAAIKTLGQGRVDLTIGSALDLFGGSLKFEELVEWQRNNELL